jgi:hypothetical protein
MGFYVGGVESVDEYPTPKTDNPTYIRDTQSGNGSCVGLATGVQAVDRVSAPNAQRSRRMLLNVVEVARQPATLTRWSIRDVFNANIKDGSHAEGNSAARSRDGRHLRRHIRPSEYSLSDPDYPQFYSKKVTGPVFGALTGRSGLTSL